MSSLKHTFLTNTRVDADTFPSKSYWSYVCLLVFTSDSLSRSMMKKDNNWRLSPRDQREILSNTLCLRDSRRTNLLTRTTDDTTLMVHFVMCMSVIMDW
jgi:hypothetical protein